MYIAIHLVAIVSCDGTLNTVAVLASRSGTSHDQLYIDSVSFRSIGTSHCKSEGSSHLEPMVKRMIRSRLLWRRVSVLLQPGADRTGMSPEAEKSLSVHLTGIGSLSSDNSTRGDDSVMN